MNSEKDKEIKIVYTNWKGQTSVRKIVPKEIIFGSNEWHKEAQWILVAYDADKKADRNFALKGITSWYV